MSIKHLLDDLLVHFKARSFSQLSRKLDINESTLARIRDGKYGVSSNFILKCHDTTGWSIEKIRSYFSEGSVKKKQKLTQQ